MGTQNLSLILFDLKIQSERTSFHVHEGVSRFHDGVEWNQTAIPKLYLGDSKPIKQHKL